jgi:hypothetical protein
MSYEVNRQHVDAYRESVPHTMHLIRASVKLPLIHLVHMHELSFRPLAGRHTRHNADNGFMKTALASAEVPSKLEPCGLF